MTQSAKSVVERCSLTKLNEKRENQMSLFSVLRNPRKNLQLTILKAERKLKTWKFEGVSSQFLPMNWKSVHVGGWKG